MIDLTALGRGEAATLEGLGSGTALGRRASAIGLPTDGARIVQMVHAADPDATRLWNDLVSVIGIGVANLGPLFSPQAIVLGGGVGRKGDLLLPLVREYLGSVTAPNEFQSGGMILGTLHKP